MKSLLSLIFALGIGTFVIGIILLLNNHLLGFGYILSSVISFVIFFANFDEFYD